MLDDMANASTVLALLKLIWEKRGYCSYHDFQKLGYSARQFYYAAKVLEGEGLVKRLGHGRYLIMMKEEWMKNIIASYTLSMTHEQKDAFLRYCELFCR
ncbi:MAG: hypothetical protein QXT39_06790 [Conexivisphaerales archaeon]